MYLIKMSRKYAPNRLSDLRKRRKLSREKLAGMMVPPITPSTVQKLEEGMMGFTLDYMLSVARALEINPAELFDENTTVAQTENRYPVLGKVPAGNWREAINDPQGYVSVTPGIGGPNCFALRPDGDSMNRLIPDDAPKPFILVDPDQKDPVNGYFYVVQNAENETTFKRFRHDPLRFEPCSSNPAHKPILIGHEPFVVVGRVVFAGMEL